MVIGVGIAARKLRGCCGIPPVFGCGHRASSFRFKIITVYAASVVLLPDALISTDNWLRLAAWLPNLIFAAVGALIAGRRR